SGCTMGCGTGRGRKLSTGAVSPNGPGCVCCIGERRPHIGISENIKSVIGDYVGGARRNRNWRRKCYLHISCAAFRHRWIGRSNQRPGSVVQIHWPRSCRRITATVKFGLGTLPRNNKLYLVGYSISSGEALIDDRRRLDTFFGSVTRAASRFRPIQILTNTINVILAIRPKSGTGRPGTVENGAATTGRTLRP